MRYPQAMNLCFSHQFHEQFADLRQTISISAAIRVADRKMHLDLRLETLG